MVKNYEPDPLFERYIREQGPSAGATKSVRRYEKWLQTNGFAAASVSRQMLSLFLRGVPVTARKNLWSDLARFYDFAEALSLVPEPSHVWLTLAPGYEDIIKNWVKSREEDTVGSAIVLGQGFFDYSVKQGIQVAEVTWNHMELYFRSSIELQLLSNWHALRSLHSYLCLQGYVLETRRVSSKISYLHNSYIEDWLLDAPTTVVPGIVRAYGTWLGERGEALEDTDFSWVDTYADELNFKRAIRKQVRVHLRKLYAALEGDGLTKLPTAPKPYRESVLSGLPSDMQDSLAAWHRSAHAMSTKYYRRVEGYHVAKFMNWLGRRDQTLADVSPITVSIYVRETTLSETETGSVRRFAAFLATEGDGGAALTLSRRLTATEAAYIADKDPAVVDEALLAGMRRALQTRDPWRETRLRAAVLARIIFETGCRLPSLLKIGPDETVVDGGKVSLLIGPDRVLTNLPKHAAEAVLDWLAEPQQDGWRSRSAVFSTDKHQVAIVGAAVRRSCLVTNRDGVETEITLNMLSAFGRARQTGGSD